MENASPLEGLVPLATCFAQLPHIFPAKASGDWFVRQNKAELVRAGALVMLAGRWMASPQKFDAAVLQIGMRAAERAAA